MRESSIPNPRFAKAQTLLQDAVSARAFPGASLAVTHKDELVWQWAVGRFTYEPDSTSVTAETIYDLASVTKVVATTTMAALLFERVLLDLDRPVVASLPEIAADDSAKKAITFRHLLSHSSGLPGYIPLFEHCQNKIQLLQALCRVSLTAAPGGRSEYSDLGFILLGEALERIAGQDLDAFCDKEVFAPLGMDRTRFCPPPDWAMLTPPTESKLHGREGAIQGEVHDENAWTMGGVAGHAGLFAPAADIAKFALCMLREGSPVLKPKTVALFTHRTGSPSGNSYALGWDTPTFPSQSGRYLSPNSFGHLGFTGASLWCDPVRRLSVTLLTNRTWPDRKNNAIKQVRPALHDAIIEALES